MGRSRRRGGIAAAAVKHARKARDSRDGDAAVVANAIRTLVRDAPENVRVPPWLYGPLLFVADRSAPLVAKRWEIEPSGENIEDVAACLMDFLLTILYGTGREQFDEWKSRPAPNT